MVAEAAARAGVVTAGLSASVRAAVNPRAGDGAAGTVRLAAAWAGLERGGFWGTRGAGGPRR